MKNSEFLSKEALESLGKTMKRMQDQLSLVPKDAFRNLFLAQNLLSAFPKEYLKTIAEEHRKITEIYKQLDLSSLSRRIADIQKPFVQLAEQAAKTHKYIKYTEETIREANEILLSLGWWIYPDWTIPSLRKIIDAHKNGKDEEIEKAIVDYFNDKKLNEMVKNWSSNKKLSPRMQILEDAVWAHNQGKYTLSVPALLPHVEGIINENSGKKGRITHAECITILKDYLGKEFKPGTLSSLFPLAVLKFTEGLLKEKFEWGKPSKKGRHPILHGHHVSYSNEVFSLKLILLIDYIQNLI